MIPVETEERLADAERVLALHSKRIEKLEQQSNPAPAKPEQANQEQIPHAPDYSGHLEELKKLLRRQDLSVQALQVHTLISSFRDTVSKLPKVLPVQHHHHLGEGVKGLVTGGVILLMATAVSAGLSFGLYRENIRLQDSATKLRMIRQAYPGTALWADSNFATDPEEAVNLVEKLEAEQGTSSNYKE